MLPPAALPPRAQTRAPSKFFCEDDEDDEVSEPQKRDVTFSPTAIVIKIIKGSADQDLSPASSGKLDQALNAIAKLSDTPGAKKLGTVLKRLGTAVDEILGVNTPQLRKGYHQLKDNPVINKVRRFVQSTRCQVSNRLSPCVSSMKVTYYNYDHIVDGDKAEGLHYAKPAEPGLREVQFSPLTSAVFSARTKKFSTYFNASLIPSLRRLLMDPNREILARENDRVLFMNHGSRFLIESYESQGIGRSAFPIFFHAIFKEDQSYPITRELRVSSEEVLKAADTLIKDSGFQYKLGIKYFIKNWDDKGSCYVVDVAPFFRGKTGIESGIYFFIPTTYLSNKPFLEYFARS